jgi:hypothetical protein
MYLRVPLMTIPIACDNFAYLPTNLLVFLRRMHTYQLGHPWQPPRLTSADVMQNTLIVDNIDKVACGEWGLYLWWWRLL